MAPGTIPLFESSTVPLIFPGCGLGAAIEVSSFVPGGSDEAGLQGTRRTNHKPESYEGDDRPHAFEMSWETPNGIAR